MAVWPHLSFSQRATSPPRAAVRQGSIALITFIWPRLTWFFLRNAEGAASRGGNWGAAIISKALRRVAEAPESPLGHAPYLRGSTPQRLLACCSFLSWVIWR